LLKDDLADAGFSGVNLWWLGQAGFILSCNGVRILVDPYLSDTLAVKYAGQELPHRRMISPPIAPNKLRGVDWYLCTHAHSDHMDPGTLPAVAANNPGCRFLVPRAEVSTALARGVPEDRVVPVDSGETVELGHGSIVEVWPSAHEDLAKDEAGHFRYLGYLLRLDGIAIYHSGDCVPYPGLLRRLVEARVELGLLPVNGRDEYRRQRKVPGNFTLAEAVALCRDAKIPFLLAHHVGMFDFNTVSEADLLAGAASAAPEVRMLLPDVSIRYELREEQE
jgi:L-ascorbate metabolism protein UlaG (beta-lactamase superfamily)